MVRAHVAKLYREVQSASNLRETLNKAPNVESFVALANKRGFSFTLKEWNEMTNFSVEELKCDLSEIPGI